MFLLRLCHIHVHFFQYKIGTQNSWIIFKKLWKLSLLEAFLLSPWTFQWLAHKLSSEQEHFIGIILTWRWFCLRGSQCHTSNGALDPNLMCLLFMYINLVVCLSSFLLLIRILAWTIIRSSTWLGTVRLTSSSLLSTAAMWVYYVPVQSDTVS